jgi:hypothetical protein
MGTILSWIFACVWIIIVVTLMGFIMIPPIIEIVKAIKKHGLDFYWFLSVDTRGWIFLMLVIIGIGIFSASFIYFLLLVG